MMWPLLIAAASGAVQLTGDVECVSEAWLNKRLRRSYLLDAGKLTGTVAVTRQEHQWIIDGTLQWAGQRAKTLPTKHAALEDCDTLNEAIEAIILLLYPPDWELVRAVRLGGSGQLPSVAWAQAAGELRLRQEEWWIRMGPRGQVSIERLPTYPNQVTLWWLQLEGGIGHTLPLEPMIVEAAISGGWRQAHGQSFLQEASDGGWAGQTRVGAGLQGRRLEGFLGVFADLPPVALVDLNDGSQLLGPSRIGLYVDLGWIFP